MVTHYIKLLLLIFVSADDAYVRGMFQKFADYHDIRTYIGTAAFIGFTLAYFKSTYN